MQILYAEDDIDDFDFFCEIIRELDPSIECVNARDGLEAIEFLENASILPGMVFLDMNMPAQDGKGALMNIKRNPQLKSIPVVIYSTTIDGRDREQCLQLGAVNVAQKPTSIQKAKELLSELLQYH